MTNFTLDTSGAVPMPSAHGGTVPFRWGGLDPFTQGYVEALFASTGHHGDLLTGRIADGMRNRFSDFAPETLAAILQDCERYSAAYCDADVARRYPENGRQFWADRQAGKSRSFPPITPYLGDDGEVYLREAGK
jgi:hypothetical protein